ncbi:MAG: hypothetical protein K2I47_08760, partial [Odoribacter sp.]|nr:hypothetical protein [Odoribacter sp.]
SAVQVLGVVDFTRVTLRAYGMSNPVRMVSASVVSGISAEDNGCLVYGQPCVRCWLFGYLTIWGEAKGGGLKAAKPPDFENKKIEICY